MPQDIKTGSAYNTKVPQLSDTADIVAALTNYHYGVITGVAPEDVSVTGTAQTKSGIAGWFKYLDDSKAAKAGPTFTGTVVLPSATSIGTVSNIEISYLDGVTSAIQTQLNAKANTASPTFTGTVIMDAVMQGPDASTTEIFIQPTPTERASGGSLTADQILTGLIVITRTGTPANFSLTLPTGTQIEAALTSRLGSAPANNSAFRWSILGKSGFACDIYKSTGSDLLTRNRTGDYYSLQDFSANFITRKISTNSYITYLII